MCRLKTYIIIFLLIILTALTIFMPILFNRFYSTHSLNEKSLWQYTPENDNRLTSTQVVEFINNSYDDTVNYDAETLKKKLSNTLISVVNRDYKMHKFINELLSYEVNCSQTDYLISLNNSPAILNIVFAVITTDNTNIEVVFEAKTETIISFTADTPVYDSKQMENMYICLIEYFEKELKLSQNQYSFEMYNNGDRLFINCSLSYEIDNEEIDNKVIDKLLKH